MATPECTFCALITGEAPVSLVAADDLVVAFLDAFPAAEGHVLVAPRRHVASVTQLSAEEGTALWAMTQRLCAKVKAGLAPAIKLHLSDGLEADQDVPHVHMHIVPRHAGDQITIELPGRRASRSALDRVAGQLSSDPTVR